MHMYFNEIIDKMKQKTIFLNVYPGHTHLPHKSFFTFIEF